MVRYILTCFFVLLSYHAHAGFTFYGKGGQFMNSTDSGSSSASVATPPAISLTPQQTDQPPVWHPSPSAEPDVDMTGVEWRQSRGAYSGRATQEMTKKYGYRAGTYRLNFRYRAKRYFGIWMHTRRGITKLLVNRVGRAHTHVDVVLPKDDEVWFEVESPFGNWEFTFERIR